MEIDPDELVPSDETAVELNLKPNTLVTWRHQGRGPKYLKIGRAVYYRRRAIREFLAGLEQDPAAKAPEA